MKVDDPGGFSPPGAAKPACFNYLHESTPGRKDAEILAELAARIRRAREARTRRRLREWLLSLTPEPERRKRDSTLALLLALQRRLARS